MKKNPVYDGAKYCGNELVQYGSKVTAYFYVGDQIKEGEAFGDEEFSKYVDDLGSEWHKGHMLAKSLGGDNAAHNMLPMKENVNNSTFKKVENYVHKLIDNLAEIQKRAGEGPLHIQYTIERDEHSIFTVKGYNFPSKFSYSISVLREDGVNANSVRLFQILETLGISPDIKLSTTLRIDE